MKSRCIKSHQCCGHSGTYLNCEYTKVFYGFLMFSQEYEKGDDIGDDASVEDYDSDTNLATILYHIGIGLDPV